MAEAWWTAPGPVCECEDCKAAGVRKLKSPIWIDGGYDRELVEACEHHPDHRWEVVRVGDAVAHPHNPDGVMVFCRGCFVPRCGHTTEDDPCMLPRHHREDHVTASGRSWPVGYAA
jgi:hypothetical protein